MIRSMVMAGMGVLLAGCAGLVKVPDTARLQPGQLGTGYDPDITAVNLAQWAFADPARTRERPIEAARAAASMDYIAGELYTSPRWANISALTKEQLLQGRQEVRQTLGVAANVPSQAVVDRLIATSNALANNDQRAALQLLSGPVFTPPPQAVLARLSNMPYLQQANVATMHAAQEVYEPNDIRMH